MKTTPPDLENQRAPRRKYVERRKHRLSALLVVLTLVGAVLTANPATAEVNPVEVDNYEEPEPETTETNNEPSGGEERQRAADEARRAQNAADEEIVTNQEVVIDPVNLNPNNDPSGGEERQRAADEARRAQNAADEEIVTNQDIVIDPANYYPTQTDGDDDLPPVATGIGGTISAGPAELSLTRHVDADGVPGARLVASTELSFRGMQVRGTVDVISLEGIVADTGPGVTTRTQDGVTFEITRSQSLSNPLETGTDAAAGIGGNVSVVITVDQNVRPNGSTTTNSVDVGANAVGELTFSGLRVAGQAGVSVENEESFDISYDPVTDTMTMTESSSTTVNFNSTLLVEGGLFAESSETGTSGSPLGTGSTVINENTIELGRTESSTTTTVDFDTGIIQQSESSSSSVFGNDTSGNNGSHIVPPGICHNCHPPLPGQRRTTQDIKNDCDDPDGDGWGWDGSKSCQVNTSNVSSTPAAVCDDPDGDGWGWDGSKSCQVNTSNVSNTPAAICDDPDGDGWGWDGSKSCQVNTSNVSNTPAAICDDPDGDGWGWDGSKSCRMS